MTTRCFSMGLYLVIVTRVLGESLRQQYGANGATALLEPFHALATDDEFWKHTQSGLAVLAAPGFFRVYPLLRTVPERAVVADSFHVKPLLRIMQSADAYHVLTLNRRTDRYFRAVDRSILEQYSRPSGLPLILAALSEYHEPFQSVSQNPSLLTEGIEINAAALSPAELCRRAWRTVEPRYLARLGHLVERFGAARGVNLGDENLPDIAAAAVAGRVATILIEAPSAAPCAGPFLTANPARGFANGGRDVFRILREFPPPE